MPEPTRVVNRHRHYYDVLITRPSKWGNPFRVEEYGLGKCIELYRHWLYLPQQRELLLSIQRELRGKTLG